MTHLSPEHRSQIDALINELVDQDEDLSPETHLFDDLGFDSIDAADLAAQLEEWVLDLNPEADVEPLDDEWLEWVTVGGIYSTMEKIL